MATDYTDYTDFMGPFVRVISLIRSDFFSVAEATQIMSSRVFYRQILPLIFLLVGRTPKAVENVGSCRTKNFQKQDMKTALRLALLTSTCLLAAGAAEERALYLDASQPREARVEDLLKRLTLEEKVSLLHGDSKFTTAAIPRLGIPRRWMSDGPHGVREDIGPDTFGRFMPHLVQNKLSAKYRRNVYNLLKVLFEIAVGIRSDARESDSAACAPTGRGPGKNNEPSG